MAKFKVIVMVFPYLSWEGVEAANKADAIAYMKACHRPLPEGEYAWTAVEESLEVDNIDDI